MSTSATDTNDVEVTEAPAYTQLSEEVAALMDRAVRAARQNSWCLEFSRIAGPIFGVPLNEVVDSDGLNCKGFNREGYNAEGWNVGGYNTRGYNREGYNAEGYDQYGFNAEGLDSEGRDKFKYDYNGYDAEGYDSYGERARRDRSWYAQQAERPATDFRYDSNGRERPKAKTTIKEKLGF